MIVTIHQPEHIPWLGFFNKVEQAELLVLLDVVQYRKNYFQNRNRILGPDGTIWLTVPVLTKGHMSKTIKDMEINNATSWRDKYWKSIYYNYKKHPYFADYAPFFEETCKREWQLLVELNEYIIRYFLDVLGIKTEVLRASEMGAEGTRSELLLDICLRTNATAYLAGQHGKDYLNETIFAEQDIQVMHHQFVHPVYPQFRREEFVSHLSTLDLLFNCGKESLQIIRTGSTEKLPTRQ